MFDAIVIFILVFGFIIGFKRGMISQTFSCVGLFLVLYLAFVFKNPLSEFMYLHFPFFKFSSNISLLNILIYEGISFLIAITFLLILYKIILKITKIVDKLVECTIILALPSKLIGAVMGFIESYIIVFIFCFLITVFSIDDIDKSKFKNKILLETPFLSNHTEKFVLALDEITEIKDKLQINNNESQLKVLDIFLKYDIITPESTHKLIDSGKLNIKGEENILKKYENN